MISITQKFTPFAERMRAEDKVLFYVKGWRVWTVTTTITSSYFEEREPIWTPDGRGAVYPWRVKMKPDIILDDTYGINALLLAPRMEYIKRWAPEDWPLAFIESLHLIPQRDFRLVEGEMERALRERGIAHEPSSSESGLPV